MIIDLRKCIGCKTCVAVCSEINNSPPGSSWRKVIEHPPLDGVGCKRIFLPINCMHCEKPFCQEVCPTTATYTRGDGVVDINYDLCIGCGACIVACPYRVRSIVHREKMHTTPSYLTECDRGSSDRIGVCTKCNFCLPRIDSAIVKGLKPGIDLDATPLCVVHCIADALHFGDLDEKCGKIALMIEQNKTYCIHEELGSRPAVYYVPDSDR